MAKHSKFALALAAVAVTLFLSSCGQLDARLPEPEVEPHITQPVSPTPTPQVESVPENPWSEEDVEAMALTLAGECYDDKVQDKRLVCEVILNRVSAGNFGGSTVLEVVSAPYQFDGYWTQSRPVSSNDRLVAEQALSDWHENGCEALSEYLFFEAGENRENVFRAEY